MQGFKGISSKNSMHVERQKEAAKLQFKPKNTGSKVNFLYLTMHMQLLAL